MLRSARLFIALFALIALSTSAGADVLVFASGAVDAALKRASEKYAAATGERVRLLAATLNEIQKRIEAGAYPDALILPAATIETMRAAGELQAGEAASLARVGIGVAVRQGVATPDVSTGAALREALLNARSIVYPDPRGGGYAGARIAQMIDAMGIETRVRAKTKHLFAFSGGVESVARGDAEIGLFNVSEILAVSGAALAGPLPAPYQAHIEFSGAIHARAQSPQNGAAFLRFLESADMRDIWVAAGFESSGAALVLLSPGATEGALKELLPRFEQKSGRKVRMEFGPAGSLAARVRRGDTIDAVISSQPEISALRDAGLVALGSDVELASVGIGLFVRKGDPKPDVSSASAFLTALARAKAIAYADPALGGSASILVAELLKSLDGDGAIAAKTRLTPPAKPLVDLVAQGGADFGFQPIAQIFLDPRIDYAGAVPTPLQRYSSYVASRVTTSARDEAYRALMDFLGSAEARSVWNAKGFEPR